MIVRFFNIQIYHSSLLIHKAEIPGWVYTKEDIFNFSLEKIPILQYQQIITHLDGFTDFSLCISKDFHATVDMRSITWLSAFYLSLRIVVYYGIKMNKSKS